jgi:hypothetical protein
MFLPAQRQIVELLVLQHPGTLTTAMSPLNGACLPFGCRIAPKFVVYKHRLRKKERELRRISLGFTFLALTVFPTVPASHAQRGDRRFRNEELRKTENIEENTRRLNLLSSQTNLPPEVLFLRMQV